MNAQTVAAYQAYLDVCTSAGTDPIAAENMVLSIGREFLPLCARLVLEGRHSATAEYWQWLANEVAAGAEEAGQ